MPSDGADHEQGGVGGAQPGAQLADEVGVAGGVEQVDLDVVVHERRDGQATERCCRTAAGSWSLTVVPSVTEPARLIVPVCGQQRLDQRRLPGPGVADQHHVAHPARILSNQCCGLLAGFCSDGHERPPPLTPTSRCRRSHTCSPFRTRAGAVGCRRLPSDVCIGDRRARAAGRCPRAPGGAGRLRRPGRTGTPRARARRGRRPGDAGRRVDHDEPAAGDVRAGCDRCATGWPAACRRSGRAPG